MTTADWLAAARRRWYLVVLGCLVTLGACGSVQQAAGVYWSQVDVVFLAPQSARNPNSLWVTSQSLIATAGVVERRVNEGVRGTALSSSSVSLVGEGIQDGHAVRLPNAGGQWADNFSRPVLDVQVAASSEADARAEVMRLLAEIRQTLDDLQAGSGADEFNRISTEFAPQSPVVQYIGTQDKRAMAATALLGSLLTVAAVFTGDRALTARRLRRTSRDASAAPPATSRTL